eukprot:CAMPEP_0198262872 /NCGR_PEP_ID=MMETSP1447-20131203/11320_1 /TAXON_ID=420782 /ORGANISM="Chaetoceros dichaeta, Strain CCMP1751" /LENGTH=669 /DNA_ID=CAMNT_0043951285 /DNA_START=133 /DNA_END=2142 /DNA_ORIENTATION=+
MTHDCAPSTAQECDSATSKPSVIGPQHELPENKRVSDGIDRILPCQMTLSVRENRSICGNSISQKPRCVELPNCGILPSQQQVPHPPPIKLTLSAFRKPEFAVRLTSSPPHKLLHHDYDLTSCSRVLGHGASSTVRLAKHRISGKKVAVKSIGKHDILRRYAHRGKPKETLDECEILLSLKDTHDSIISLLDVYETDSEVQLVLEYCAGGELFDAIQRRSHARDGDTNKTSNCCKSFLSNPKPNSDKHNPPHRRKRARAFSLTNNIQPCLDDETADDTAQTSAKPICSGYAEAQAARIAWQLLSALTHMHRRGIVHRDVKPENIFLVSDSEEEDNLTVKLSDFGLARVLHTQGHCKDKNKAASSSVHRHTIGTAKATPLTPPTKQQRQSRARAYSRVGSDYYAAPEVENGYGYGTAVDMYSLGVTLYILLSGFPPAARPVCGSVVLDNDTSSSEDESDDDVHAYGDHNNLPRQTSPVEFPNSHWHHISTSAKNLVRKMLHPNPSFRISAHHALQHEWIVVHLQALQIEAFESPFSSLKKPSPPSRGAEHSTPIVSFSSLQFNYLASKSFESKKRKLRSTNTTYPRNDDKSKQRRKKNKRSFIAIPTPNNKQLRHCISPSQSIVSVSMVELYNQVNSVAVAATAAAAGLMEDVNDSDNSIDIGSVLKIIC